MRTDAANRLTFVATARAAALLGHRADLELRADSAVDTSVADESRVLLATPLDDVRGTPPRNSVRIAVLEDVSTAFDDARFDDFVLPSSSRPEIVSRSLRALLRKQPAPICLRPMSLEVRGCVVPLSVTEHGLLARLMERFGAPVSRADLERTMGEGPSNLAPEPGETGRALDAHIYRLRRKLRGVPGVRLETLRQRGFSITIEDDPPVSGHSRTLDFPG